MQDNKADLLLAEVYAASGQEELALQLFEHISAVAPAGRTFSSHRPCSKARGSTSPDGSRKNFLRPDANVVKVLAQLKTLVLQKNLSNEPVHLEAALGYVDLQAF